MDPRLFDQQPIGKTVGRRSASPVGHVPTSAARAAWDAMAIGYTGSPKGVIRYASHEEMIQDRERWTAEAIAAQARQRA